MMMTASFYPSEVPAKTSWQESDQLLTEVKKLQQDGKLREALAKINKGIRDNGDSPALYSTRASIKLDLKDAKSALKDADKAIGIREDRAPLHSMRAKCLLALKRYDQALKSIDKAIALKPGRANFVAVRSEILDAMGKKTEAKVEREKSLEMEPRTSEGCIQRSDYFLNRGDFDRASQWIDQAIRKDKKNIEAYKQKAHIETKKKNYSKALLIYDQALKIDNSRADLFFRKAEVEGICLMNIKGIEDCDRAIMRKKNDGQYYALRGQLAAQLGRFEEAENDFKRAIELSPKDSLVRSRRADMYLDRKQYEQCIKECSIGYQQNPQSMRLLLIRAKAYEQSGKRKEALADYSKVIKENGGDPYKLFTAKAALEAEMGLNVDAIKDYTDSLKYATSSLKPRVYTERAKLYSKIGKESDAKADRAKAKALSSGFAGDLLRKE